MNAIQNNYSRVLGRKYALADVPQGKFDDYINEARDALLPFDYEIRTTQHQRTKARTWAIVNSTSDALTQLATIHTAEEIGYITRILYGMFETHNSQRKEVMAITSMQALERKYLKPSGEAADGGDKGLTQTDAEKCLSSLVREGWFEKSRESFYTLTPRALMELKPWLVETFNEPAEAEEWQPIKTCVACKEIVTMGQRCSNAECNVRLHDICEGYWNRKEKKCPACKTSWDRKGPVGQRVVTATDDYLRSKRKSGGGGSGNRRGRAREEVVEDDEEEEEEAEVDG